MYAMGKKELTGIIVTAIVGFIFGIYIFWSGFFTTFGGPSLPSQAELDEFTLVSQVYGGCRDQCPSFQILADGSYRYRYTPEIGAEQVIRDGSIPRSLRRELLNAMNEKTLEAQSQTLEPSFCNSYTDGIDVIYRVTYKDIEYEIDTCGTMIDTNSVLWNTLVKTWNYFETGGV